MPSVLASVLLAITMIAIALLAVFDVVPQQAAEYSILAVPALASAAIIRSDTLCCAGARQ